MKKAVSVIICIIMIFAAVSASVSAEKALTYVPADIYVDAATAAKGSEHAGDVNMDSEVDNKDVVALFRSVSGSVSGIDELAADCNGDASIDNKDVVVLFRYLSGQGVELKYGTEAGYPAASNDKLSMWFSEEIKLDPETWDVLAPEGFDSISEFVIRRARAKYIEEVTVLKVAEGGALEDVKAMAEYRCAKEKNNSDYTLYDDDDHRNAKMLDQGVVEVIGKFVLYVVTEDTPTSVTRAKNFVAANPDCSALELYKAIVIEE